MYPYFQCFIRIFCVDRLLLMLACLHMHVGASNLRFRVVSIFISLISYLIRYEVTKRSRPSYPRDTANRFDLTLQGGPNQHGTHTPRRTTRTNHSSPRLELQDHPTIIWSAEPNMRPPKVIHASPILCDYSTTTKGEMESCTFEARQY